MSPRPAEAPSSRNSSLPALLVARDALPEQAPLNGRRVAYQQLLNLWAAGAGDNTLHLALPSQDLVLPVRQYIEAQGFKGLLSIHGLLDPSAFTDVGALFVPDLTIGRFASWRQSLPANSFSIIGQIHTLASNRALSAIERLVDEPLSPWDALICSSTAGRDVVLKVMEARREHLRRHLGATRFPTLQLPVIPLPLPDSSFALGLDRDCARHELGIPANARVLLWLGRLSMLTKADPWPTYHLLQLLAEQLSIPLVLIECGPDDLVQHVDTYERLRKLCPNVHFIRLGGAQPVSDFQKSQAMAAADLAISLVDNIQETFGLSVAEAMAAGLPVIASNWDGYRDLIADGITGVLIPTHWSSSSPVVSRHLGWQHELGLVPYETMTGLLAQLVTVDFRRCLPTLLDLLNSSERLMSMGAAARQIALERFSSKTVLASYRSLFASLKSLRSEASVTEPELEVAGQQSLRLDPQRAFVHFASIDPHSTNSIAHNQDRFLDQLALNSAVHQELWGWLRQNGCDLGALIASLKQKHCGL